MPSTVLNRERIPKGIEKTCFLLLGSSQLYQGPKSFTQMVHLREKIETYKSNIGAKWCDAFCKGHGETRRKSISIHAMLQQPQMKASDEHVASIHSERWWNLNHHLGLWALISGLPPPHSSTFGKLSCLSLPALQNGSSNQAPFFRAGKE